VVDGLADEVQPGRIEAEVLFDLPPEAVGVDDDRVGEPRCVRVAHPPVDPRAGADGGRRCVRVQ